MGNLFGPLVCRYFEQKHSVSAFGHSISLNLASRHPLFRKVTCSPDGYFLNKRKIAINRIRNHYRDQIQTGLAFRGESVNKGLYVNAYFRMCSLKQLELSQVPTSFLTHTALKIHPYTCMGSLLFVQQTKNNQ